jgi:HPt (histidine-containing phosphotransfer) domain-containing protein
MPPTADVPIVFETLLERCMGDAGFCREMLGLFKQQMTAHLATLDQAMAVKDVEGVRKVTHAMKGSSANLSADALSARCAAAEQTAKSAALPAASAIDAIKLEYARVIAYYPTIEARL